MTFKEDLKVLSKGFAAMGEAAELLGKGGLVIIEDKVRPDTKEDENG